ncbi:MAG: GatB/YqeY domain-containing protein [Saprospiraceae bacterium]|nr:GatB/YqeY domain-containing protein [Saprospiraceae bacterium]
MNLETKIQSDLIAAMKAKDEVALRGVRAIKAAILLAKTDGSGKEFDAEAEVKLLQKLVKQRRESISIFEQNGRAELAKTEKEEIDIIEKYLPQQLSEAEIEAIVENIIAQTGASSMKDMGKVVGAANKHLAGRAEGATIAGVVKKLLS